FGKRPADVKHKILRQLIVTLLAHEVAVDRTIEPDILIQDIMRHKGKTKVLVFKEGAAKTGIPYRNIDRVGECTCFLTQV
ncbi:hypothetical protein RTF48_24930, partial [Escherichia coli]|uniref:hypothetical protein n=1 Tax=Escherichia coli TaxID=562 RepID=UPI0028E70003